MKYISYMKDILLYWPRFLEEAWFTFKYYQAVKSIESELTEGGLRVDWIGRIYTVINLPEEVATAPISQEGYVLMELRKHDQFLLQLGIADYVSPEFSRIDGTDSFLLVLSPDREYFRLWPLIKSLLRTGGIILAIRLMYVIFEHNQEKITELWNKLMTLVF